MKKIDKLILRSFIGPFIMTFLVVVFILLTQHMLKYFDDIIGKGLGWEVLSQLLFYFAVFMTPVAMPLAVLLSALITFGNMGEHFELTAIKGAGISLVRILQPIFFFVLILTGIAFYVNNNLVPKAALEAYSLLYDIKQKKPALDLKEGAFYNGLPDVSIKVNKKFPDGITLKDIIVYNHKKNNGNKEVILADSGRMSTILNERYFKFELFNGYSYTESEGNESEIPGGEGHKETLTRSKFYKKQVVFDLSSFQLSRTDKSGFETHRIMRNLSELDRDIDSLNGKVMQQEMNYDLSKGAYFRYFNKGSMKAPGPSVDSTFLADTDSLFAIAPSHTMVQSATNMARQVKSQIVNGKTRIENFRNEKIIFETQWHKIIASSFMCIAMFLIGAPLGAIIKRGGLGVPFLISVLFFIIHYILNMQGEKLAKQGLMSPMAGIWAADAILLILGVIFLRQARADARLFEADAYLIYFDRFRQWFRRRKIQSGIMS